MNDTPPIETARHPDSDLIDALGGAAVVARKLGFDPAAGGAQRVQNWKYRGIPELIRLKRPDVFGPAPSEGQGREAA
jgi:hypothetical protein